MTRTWITAAFLFALGAGRAQSQKADATFQKTFFTPRDGVAAAGVLAASAGLSVFDVRIAHWFRDTSLTHVRIGGDLDGYFTHINESTLTVGGLGVWVIARVLKQRTVADVMFHAAESVAAASITSQVIRGPLGRTRPLDTDPPFGNQYEFHFFRGFTNFDQRAFPSIHSASGFAFASAIVAEVRLRDPAAAWIVGVPAYILALTPGLSRMYLGQHWASDIFSGAFMGTFYGWRIVDYSHAHPTTPIDRIFLGSVNRLGIGINRGGVSLRWGTKF